jgi:hypothetical protein
MTRAAIYARVSTKEQSTEAQVAQLTAYCQARGWTEVAVFRDDGISGVRDNRPELDRLRQRMAAGEFDAIVASKMDRLGRSLGMILRFWDEADAAGSRVIVIDRHVSGSPSLRAQAYTASPPHEAHWGGSRAGGSVRPVRYFPHTDTSTRRCRLSLQRIPNDCIQREAVERQSMHQQFGRTPDPRKLRDLSSLSGRPASASSAIPVPTSTVPAG